MVVICQIFPHQIRVTSNSLNCQYFPRQYLAVSKFVIISPVKLICNTVIDENFGKFLKELWTKFWTYLTQAYSVHVS